MLDMLATGFHAELTLMVTRTPMSLFLVAVPRVFAARMTCVR